MFLATFFFVVALILTTLIEKLINLQQKEKKTLKICAQTRRSFTNQMCKLVYVFAACLFVHYVNDINEMALYKVRSDK